MTDYVNWKLLSIHVESLDDAHICENSINIHINTIEIVFGESIQLNRVKHSHKDWQFGMQ